MADQHNNLEKPKNVVLAVQLLWSALAAGLINTVVNWDIISAITREASKTMPPDFPLNFTAFIVITQGVTFAFIIWMYLKISSGRNWARILFAIVTIIGLPFGVLSLITYFNISKFGFFFSVIALFLNMAALCLLFSKPASAWYKKLKVIRMEAKLKKLTQGAL